MPPLFELLFNPMPNGFNLVAVMVWTILIVLSIVAIIEAKGE